MVFEPESLVSLASYLGAGLAMGLGAIGAAVGEGYTAGAASGACASRPELSGNIIKNMLIGQAVAESAAIFALVVAMLLLFMEFEGGTTTAVSLLAGGMCMGFGAIGSGVGSGYPAAEACTGMARQPEATNSLTNTMILGAAICQSPGIFSLVIGLIMMFLDFGDRAVNPNAMALLGAGFSTGLAAIGSGMGQGLTAGGAVKTIARQPLCSGRATATMLVGQAVAETPAIFGLLISVLLIFRVYPASSSIITATALVAAGLCQGLGGIGPGIGNGLTARSALDWFGRREEAGAVLTRTMLIGQAVAQSTAIYAMVIALVLIFVV